MNDFCLPRLVQQYQLSAYDALQAGCSRSWLSLDIHPSGDNKVMRLRGMHEAKRTFHSSDAMQVHHVCTREVSHALGQRKLTACSHVCIPASCSTVVEVVVPESICCVLLLHPRVLMCLTQWLNYLSTIDCSGRACQNVEAPSGHYSSLFFHHGWHPLTT